jgi:hypothetical protein
MDFSLINKRTAHNPIYADAPEVLDLLCTSLLVSSRNLITRWIIDVSRYMVA